MKQERRGGKGTPARGPRGGHDNRGSIKKYQNKKKSNIKRDINKGGKPSPET